MADGLLVGVDAGGTSTKALALDLNTGQQRTARAEGANWTVHGPDLCRERLGTAVTEAAAGRPIHSLALCIAGYYPPDHAETAHAWARQVWPDVPHLSIQTDVHAAWAGAFGGEPGIVVISGTGSIAYGRNAAGQEARAGGWGPLFGDDGSAYDVALHMLRQMGRDIDQGREMHLLYRSVMQRWPELGADPVTWLRGIYRLKWGREQISEISSIIAMLGDAGDQVAGGYLGLAGIQLALQAYVVGNRLELGQEGTPVALQGGFGAGSSCLWDAFADAAERFGDTHKLLPRRPRMAALAGAVILGGMNAGIPAVVATGALDE